jgi:hypothetical protein
MNFADMYSENLSGLLSMSKQLDTKIYDKEVEMFKSPETEPLLIDWLKNNLEQALLYIPHVKDNTELGIDSDEQEMVFWDNFYIRSIYPEDDRLEFLTEGQDHVYPNEFCVITICLVDKNPIYLTNDNLIFTNGYETQTEYKVFEKYAFVAEILEKLIIAHRDEIWEAYHKKMITLITE